MRPRCLGAHMAALCQLDSSATEAAGQYNDLFREPKIVDDDSWAGASGRVNQSEIRVPCQADLDDWNRMDPMANGIETQHHLRVTFAFKDLERAGLIDADTKVAGIRITAQLMGLYDRRGTLLLDMSNDNVFCEQTLPKALIGSSIGLLQCTFACREKGTKG
jgi:hypothetical protein